MQRAGRRMGFDFLSAKGITDWILLPCLCFKKTLFRTLAIVSPVFLEVTSHGSRTAQISSLKILPIRFARVQSVLNLL